jgi:hypothetical protein
LLRALERVQSPHGGLDLVAQADHLHERLGLSVALGIFAPE